MKLPTNCCLIMSSASKTNQQKRKRVVLSIDDKLAVCDMVKSKVSKVDIMEKFGIARRTVNDICKVEDSLRQFKESKKERGCKRWRLPFQYHGTKLKFLHLKRHGITFYGQTQRLK